MKQARKPKKLEEITRLNSSRRKSSNGGTPWYERILYAAEDKLMEKTAKAEEKLDEIYEWSKEKAKSAGVKAASGLESIALYGAPLPLIAAGSTLAATSALDLTESRGPWYLAGASVLVGITSAALAAIEYKYGPVRAYLSHSFRNGIEKAKKATDAKIPLLKAGALAATLWALPISYTVSNLPTQIERGSIPVKLTREITQEQKREIPVEYEKIVVDDDGKAAPLLKFHILQLTKNDEVRKKTSAQIIEFNKKYAISGQHYAKKFAVDTKKFSTSHLFGLLSTESELNPYVVSRVGAAGIGQLMPFSAEFYLGQCGGGSVYKTKESNQANRMKDPKIREKLFSEYANALRSKRNQSLKRDPSGKELERIHAPFNPEKAICMTTAYLKKTQENHPKEASEVHSLRYHTGGDLIRWAMEQGQRWGDPDFKDWVQYTGRHDSANYAFSVQARAIIHQMSPNGAVMPPEFYIKPLVERAAQNQIRISKVN